MYVLNHSAKFECGVLSTRRVTCCTEQFYTWYSWSCLLSLSYPFLTTCTLSTFLVRTFLNQEKEHNNIACRLLISALASLTKRNEDEDRGRARDKERNYYLSERYQNPIFCRTMWGVVTTRDVLPFGAKTIYFLF